MAAKKRKKSKKKYGPSVGNTVKKVMRKKKAGKACVLAARSEKGQESQASDRDCALGSARLGREGAAQERRQQAPQESLSGQSGSAFSVASAPTASSHFSWSVTERWRVGLVDNSPPTLTPQIAHKTDILNPVLGIRTVSSSLRT